MQVVLGKAFRRLMVLIKSSEEGRDGWSVRGLSVTGWDEVEETSAYFILTLSPKHT